MNDHEPLVKRHHGRPSALTPERHRIIIEALTQGMFVETAATLAGINPATLYRWLQQGNTETPTNPDTGEQIDDGNGPFRDFREAVAHARASAEQQAVASLWEVAAGGALIEESVRYVPGTRDQDAGEIVSKKYTPPDAKPMMFLLERMFAARWGRRETLAIVDESALTGSAQVDEGTGSDEILAVTRRLVAAIEERKAEAEADAVIVDAVIVDDPS